MRRWFYIFGILICSGCSPDTEMPVSQPDKQLQFLALGDSYTIGQGVEESLRFPHQTTDLLRSDGLSIQTPRYIAQTGWTSDQLLNAIDRAGLSDTFDVVTLLIGVNDQYRGRDTASYKKGFISCLKHALALAGNRSERVVVLSIPDYSVTPVGRNGDSLNISMEIDRFNQLNRKIAEQEQVAYLDVTTSSRRASSDGQLIATDGLHPSGLEYRNWAAMLSPLIRKMFP